MSDGEMTQWRQENKEKERSIYHVSFIQNGERAKRKNLILTPIGELWGEKKSTYHSKT